MLMTQRLGSFSAGWLLVPATLPSNPPVLDDHGRGLRSADADAAAQRVLDRVGRDVIKTLIVEDDLARRGDANLGAAVAFVEDRVLRWVDCSRNTEGAAAMLRNGSSGYPLNAFACRAAVSELGLSPGRALSADEQKRVTESTALIIVSIYDAEAFLTFVDADIELRLA